MTSLSYENLVGDTPDLLLGRTQYSSSEDTFSVTLQTELTGSVSFSSLSASFTIPDENDLIFDDFALTGSVVVGSSASTPGGVPLPDDLAPFLSLVPTDVAAVPEPSAGLLFGFGTVAAASRLRRSRA